jgi:tetratricopeptide (TPR) repeat protein
MNQQLIRWSLLLWLAGFVLAGCARLGQSGAADQGGHPGAGARRQELAEAEEEADLERRAEAHAHFAAAVSADLNDAPDRAAEHLYQAAVADLTNVDLVMRAAARLLQADLKEQAVGLLERATALPGAPGPLWATLGAACQELDRTDLATRAYQTALERSPQLLAAYRGLALLLARARQPAEARRVLDRAASQAVEDPAYYIEVAELYADYGRLEPAEADAVKAAMVDALDRAAALQPDDLSLIQRLAQGYRSAGAWDKAESFFTALLERLREMPHLNPALLEVLRTQLADLYLRSGKKTEAAQQLATITQENPRNAQAVYFQGTLAYEAKQYAQAEQCFERVLLLQPAFEPVYYDLAGVKVTLNKPDEALRVIEQARERFKKTTFAMEFYAAVAQMRAKRFEEAVRHFTEAELLARTGQTNRLNSGFYFQFGAACERRGDYRQAEQHFRKCLEQEPDFAEALNYLGYMWADRGENLAEARQLIEKAVALEPENGAFLDSLGWVLFKLGQPRQALPWLEKAIAHTDEPDATLYDHLGDVHAALGDLEQARAAWRKALGIEPTEALRRKLEPTPPHDSSP